MSLRRLFLAAVVAVCVGMVVPAEAGPLKDRTYTAPFGNANGYTADECANGATCTPFGSAQRNGTTTASVRYDRTAATRLDEYTAAGGSYFEYAFMPRGARSARVTVTWRVVSASTTATAPEGSIYATTSLFSSVRCGPQCAKATSFKTITYACEQQSVRCGLPLPGAAPASVGVVDVQLVSEVADIDGGVLGIQTSASGYVGGEPACIYAFGRCNTLVSTHRGSARATIRAQLRSIHVDFD